jgi:hypothetical protein
MGIGVGSGVATCEAIWDEGWVISCRFERTVRKIAFEGLVHVMCGGRV